MSKQVTSSGNVDMEVEEKPSCQYCGKEVTFLGPHLKKQHGMTLGEYHKEMGNYSVASPEVMEAFYNFTSRKGTDSYFDTVNINGIEMKVRPGKTESPFEKPNGYKYPQKGDAGKAVKRLARALKYSSMSDGHGVAFIYGPAGNGKTTIFQALSDDLNMEASFYEMREDIDPGLYLGREQLIYDEESGGNVSHFSEGPLIKDLRGRVGEDGVRRPVLIAIEDIDRGPPEYHEIWRHILEDGKVRIPETGEIIDVYPGTILVATANSRGRGDETGLYRSAQVMDDSILDRFKRFIEFPFLEIEEEKEILKKKFPYLKNNAPKAIDIIGEVTKDLRHMIENEGIFFSFGLRRVIDWAEGTIEIIKENNGTFENWMAKEAAQDFLDRYPLDIREAIIKRALDVHI